MHAARIIPFVLVAFTCACARRPAMAPMSWARQSVGAPASAPFVLASSEARVLPVVAPSRCESVEIAPGRWVAPLCRTLPAVAVDEPPLFHLVGAAPLPLQVDLRARDLAGPVRDQDRVGVCWAGALATVMDTGARRLGAAIDVSMLHVVANDAYRDLWRPGRAKAVTSESSWRYEPRKACAFEQDADDVCGGYLGVRPGSWRNDPWLVAELHIAERAPVVRIGEARALAAQPAHVAQLERVLAGGDAIWAAFEFNRDGWRAAALERGVFGDYEPTGQTHAVAIVGYRTTLAGVEFLIKNSWGPEWAHGGHAWMPEAVLVRHLVRAVRVRVEIVGAVQPRQTEPPPAHPCGLLAAWLGSLAAACPSLPRCSGTNVLDVVNGTCAPRCANGLPPAMGRCF
jgi:hypothetical protein